MIAGAICIGFILGAANQIAWRYLKRIAVRMDERMLTWLAPND